MGAAERQRIVGYAAAVLTGAIVGLTWVLQSHVLGQKIIGAAELNWLNMIGLSLIVWPVALSRARANPGGRLLPQGTPVRWLVVFACCAAAIFYFRNVGVGLCGATTAAVVTRVELALVFALTYLVLKQRVAPWGWVGAALLVAGVFRVSGVGAEALDFHAFGVAALVISAIGVATNALIIKTQFGKVTDDLIILFSATTQTIVFSVVVPGFVGFGWVAGLLARPDVLWLVALGSAAIAANLFTYYFAMKRAPMWTVRILALIGPPVAMVADHFLLGTPITAAGVQGLTAVMIGATMVILSGRERAANGGQRRRTAAT